MVNLCVGEFRDVDQALDAIFQMGKSAKICDIGDPAHYTLVDIIFGIYQAPRVRL